MPHPSRRRPGVTLFELLVVLVILGIGGALVVPALRDVRADALAEGDPWTAARRLAARRGESVRLAVASDGTWRVSAERDTTDMPLVQGSAPGTVGGTWLVTAVGACLPVAVAGARVSADLGWDPVRCAPIPLAAAAP